MSAPNGSFPDTPFDMGQRVNSPGVWTAFQQGTVDLDIQKFEVQGPKTFGKVKCPKKRKSYKITLWVTNGGTVDEPRLAIITGSKSDGSGTRIDVYSQSLLVSASVDGLPKKWEFPEFESTDPNGILWEARIEDNDSDDDVLSLIKGILGSSCP